MFGRKKTPETLNGSHAVDAPAETGAVLNGEPMDRPDRSQGKNAPTPTRREREAARKRPLVPDDRKAARQAARQAEAMERGKMRLALETGDERHMPVRDRGPQKRWTRDYVDARTGIAEWLMIVVLVYVLLAFIPVPELQLILTFSLWGLVVLVILEGILLSRTLKRKLAEKFGEVEKGVAWYGVMRALQLRRLRLPKPQVKRGQYPA
ncbi:DUF3043 domain-containing protein [Micrococcus sp. IITD107]|uniref:DUF3043 domain-containing protein n=1 Tax=Micrococcus sp. IITD107 TaxID=3342790 RepID=UPI0035B6CF53